MRQKFHNTQFDNHLMKHVDYFPYDDWFSNFLSSRFQIVSLFHYVSCKSKDKIYTCSFRYFKTKIYQQKVLFYLFQFLNLVSKPLSTLNIMKNIMKIMKKQSFKMTSWFWIQVQSRFKYYLKNFQTNHLHAHDIWLIN